MRLLYFAWLRARLGQAEEELPLPPEVRDVAGLVDWLRALAKKVHGECGGKGVGAVGMCFTGGYALAMMTEPSVVAPVLLQPSMPVALLKRNRGAIDVSDEEIACAKRRFENEDLSLIGLRRRGRERDA